MFSLKFLKDDPSRRRKFRLKELDKVFSSFLYKKIPYVFCSNGKQFTRAALHFSLREMTAGPEKHDFAEISGLLIPISFFQKLIRFYPPS